MPMSAGGLIYPLVGVSPGSESSMRQPERSRSLSRSFASFEYYLRSCPSCYSEEADVHPSRYQSMCRVDHSTNPTAFTSCYRGQYSVSTPLREA
jgi:hypothetical protein